MTARRQPVFGLALLSLALLGQAPESSRLPLPPGGSREASPLACGCTHVCHPTTYQGCGCGSLSCFPGGNKLISLETDSRAAAALTGPAPCVEALAAGTFPCFGIDLAGYVPLETLSPGATSASNLWGFQDLADGREYAVIGVSNGTAIVDVSLPERPRVVAALPGPESAWREVKVYQRRGAEAGRSQTFAYVVSEAPTAGLQILDLSGLPDSVGLAATFRAFDTSHTVTLSNVDPATGAAAPGGPDPVLYVQGARSPTVGIFALGLSDPTSPTVLGQYTSSYGHDTWTGRVTGDRALACAPGHDPCDLVVVWTGRDIRVLDWTDKASPQILATTSYPDIGYPHSGWISRDGNSLFSMDELDDRMTGDNSRVRVFDVHDWSRPAFAAEWTSRTKAIEHNGYTVGDRYYMSHYERGLTILDVSDPRRPAEIAYFDTYPAGEAADFHGAWGVYPFLPSGTILVSNIDGAGGLFILRPSGETPRDPIMRVPRRVRTPRR